MDPQRPIIFDYASVPSFVSDMLSWRRHTDPTFSVAQVSRTLPKCSKALVSRVAAGSRRLTRDRVSDFATLLDLTRQETHFLDRWIDLERRPKLPTTSETAVAVRPLTSQLKRPQNHILSDWVNVYVKDALHLKSFKADAVELHRLLGGIASVPRIARALKFLFREGIFRRNEQGQIVPDEQFVETTDEIPNSFGKNFHRHALEIAKQGIDHYPIEARKADAFIFAINQENLPKVKKILGECMDSIIQFREDHMTDNERLYQVVMHLTPIGGHIEKH